MAPKTCSLAALWQHSEGYVPAGPGERARSRTPGRQQLGCTRLARQARPSDPACASKKAIKRSFRLYVVKVVLRSVRQQHEAF